MAENGNKKKRIARIGHMSSGKEATKLSCDEGLIQADHNLVFNIMESMDKSQNIVSFQQLQEFRSKEKSTRINNSVSSSSSKQNNKISSSKQIKKFDSGKKYPLMAKCQQTMRNLKKNRSMPKPRAHVGPSQTPMSRLQSNNFLNGQIVSNYEVNHKGSPLNIGENSKRNRCSQPEINERPKKAKAAHSVDNSSVANASQKGFDKESKLISDADTDSDAEFERFLRKHHPEKCVRRKSSENNKFKRKKSKQFVCAKKFIKVTSRTLSDSDESVESEVDHNDINRLEITSKSYRRIVAFSDDSATDYQMNDSGILDYDTSSSSENENIVNKSLNKETVADNVNMLVTFLNQQSSVVSSLSSAEDNACKELKLKCEIPCYVVIKRDPLLDNRAATLRIDNSPVTNTVSVSDADEDDCIIISETSTINFADQNSKNTTPALEERNSDPRDLTSPSKSPCSETSTSIDDVQNLHVLYKKRIYNTNSLEPQTKEYSNEKSPEAFRDHKNIPKGVSSVTALSKPVCDTEKGQCHKNRNSIICTNESVTVANPVSRQMAILPNNEMDVSLSRDTATTATEKEMFNVQILSVKSLNEPDIIVLSDDDSEEKVGAVPTNNETKESVAEGGAVPTNNETKESVTEDGAVPTNNETKESVTEDSDIEVICLDSNISREEKCVNENTKDDLDKGTQNTVNGGTKENPSSSSAQPVASVENDCIILDDLDLPSENTCSAKSIGSVQASAQLVEKINDEKTNSSKNIETTPGNTTLVSNKESILKILGTIDFNCIKKVISVTTTTHTEEERIPPTGENSLCDNIAVSERTQDSVLSKQQGGQYDPLLSQKQTLIEENSAPVVSSEVDKISSLKTSAVDTQEKHSKLVQNIKSVSANVSSSKKSNSSTPPITDSDENSSVSIKSSANNVTPKSLVSQKEIDASSRKTGPNALLHSQKNQLPPMQSYGHSSHELDMIAAKSIKDLNQAEKNSIVPLLELYRAEYEKYVNIKCTEQNVSAGLKLLEEKQSKILLAIGSSIKNIVKKDICFHKINNDHGSNSNELKSVIKTDSPIKDESKEIKQPSVTSIGNYSDIAKDDKVKIFNQSVVKTASEYLKSAGPSSSQEVYNHLINSVCAECGKHAVAACLGCAKVYYCSEECGMTHWNNGHYETCMR